MVFLLNFSLKSHLLVIFLTKNSEIKTMYLAKKTLHFKKIDAVSYGVFAQYLSKISHFVLFLTNNSKIKTMYHPLKTLHLKKNVAVSYGVFAQFLSKISIFVHFVDKKQQNKDDIKNVTFFEN